MRVRDVFRHSRPSPDPRPEPPAAARPAWPDMPPVQRVISAASLVTAPERFRQELATAANPSFLAAPGHLVAADAPSGSVTGLSRPPVPRADRWTSPPVSRRPDAGAGEWPTDDGVASGPAAVQRVVYEAEPPRRLPVVALLPASGGGDLVTAGTASVPGPVWRPAVPAEPAAPDIPPGQPDAGPLAGVPAADLPGDDPRHAPVLDVQPSRAGQPPAEEPPETIVPVPSTAPLSVQAIPHSTSVPADPVPPPRRRLGLGAPLPTTALPSGTAAPGSAPVVARLTDRPAAEPTATDSSRSAGPLSVGSTSVGPPSVGSTEPAAVVRATATGGEAVVARLSQETVPLVSGQVGQPVPLLSRLAGEPLPAAAGPTGPDHAHVPPGRSTSQATPAPTPEPVPAPTPEPVPPPQPPPAPVVSEAPPTTVVQRHRADEEAPLVGAGSLGARPADDMPVQRTHDPGTAARLPAEPSAVGSAPASAGPGGSTTPPVAEPSTPTATEELTGLAGERPLVARTPWPAAPPDRGGQAPPERLPVPVAQRATDPRAAERSERSGPPDAGGEGNSAAPASPAEVAAGAAPADADPVPTPHEATDPVGAGLVGEWPIAQRLIDAAPMDAEPVAPGPSSSPGFPGPGGESAGTATTGPATTLPAAVATAVRPLGERPMVLRTLTPFPVPPGYDAEAAGPELHGPVRSPGAAPQVSPPSMSRGAMPALPGLSATGVANPLPGLQRFGEPDGAASLRAGWVTAGPPQPMRGNPAAAVRAPLPPPAARLAVQQLPAVPGPAGPAGGEPSSVASEPAVGPETVSRLAVGDSGGANAEVDGNSVAAPPSTGAAPAAGGSPPAAGGAPMPTDALVHSLFDPLTRQFKAELRLDRERVGHALDLRY